MKVFLGILGGLAIVWFIWALFSMSKTPDYNANVSVESIKALMAARNLEICSEGNIELNDTPGFVEGKNVKLSTSCQADVNPVSMSLLKFDSEASRNAALQRASSVHRNGFGPHFAYTYGPYIITLQGSRGIADQLLVSKALTEAGARP